jgi:phosphotriesterase-related protein
MLGLLSAGAGFRLGSGLATRSNLSDAVALEAAQAPARPPAIPKGAVIRTILKDIAPDSLGKGASLFHEHLASAIPTDLNLLVTELQLARKDGLECIVDAAIARRPPEAVEHLRRAATGSGMNVVVAGGYYLQPSYPAEIAGMTDDQIADQFVQDAAAQRWGAFGEIGSSPAMYADERKIFRAISKAHLRTNLPVFTHTPHSSCPKCALEQVDVFEAMGVDPRRVCIGHLSSIKPEDDPASDTHKAVAKRGAFLGIDTVGREMNASFIPEAEKVKLVQRILDAGYEDHILLSSDYTSVKLLKTNWGMGFSTVLMQFVPKLRYAGVKEDIIRKITVDNPRRFLAFVPK